MHNNKGHTLIEILISSGIFLVFIFMLFAIYLMGVKSWQQAEVKQEIRNQGIAFLYDLAKELQHSNEYSLQLLYYTSLNPLNEDSSQPPVAPYCAISFLTPYDSTAKFAKDPATGEPLWQGYIIYYVNPQDKTIRKKRVELTDLSKTPSVIPEPMGAALINALDGQGSIKCREVIEFKAVDPTGKTAEIVRFPSNPICVYLHVEKVSTVDRQEVFKSNQMIRMFN